MATPRTHRLTFDPHATSTATGAESCHQIATLLNLCHDFFTTASPATRNELRQFLTNKGLAPHTAIGWLVDMLSLRAVNASTCDGHTHATTP